MKRLPFATLVLGAVLAGCTTPSHRPGAPPSPQVRAGGGALAVIGTPFYALGKATTCIASVLVAAPSSAALALTDRPQREWEREALQAGVGQNCTGPYWLVPAG